MKLSILTLGLFLLNSLFCAQALVHEPHFSIDYSFHGKYQMIQLKGSFDPDEEFSKIEKVFYHLDPKIKELVIDLDFAGGGILASKHFRDMAAGFCRINGCQLITLLREEATCSSSCLLIFMAGKVRVAHESARFGFHGAFVEDEDGNVAKVFSDQIIQEYQNVGISSSWLETNRSFFEKTDMSYVFARDMDMSSEILSKVKYSN